MRRPLELGGARQNKGIKADDNRVAALSARVHAMLDQERPDQSRASGAVVGRPCEDRQGTTAPWSVASKCAGS